MEKKVELDFLHFQHRETEVHGQELSETPSLIFSVLKCICGSHLTSIGRMVANYLRLQGAIVRVNIAEPIKK